MRRLAVACNIVTASIKHDDLGVWTLSMCRTALKHVCAEMYMHDILELDEVLLILAVALSGSDIVSEWPCQHSL